MSTQRIIHDPELAVLWRTHPQTLSTWHTHGQLNSDGQVGRSHTHWYYHERVDAIHKAGLVDPTLPFPSTAVLLELQEKTGMPSLLTAEETAERLDIPVSAVWDDARHGKLVGMKLPGRGKWLFAVPNVVQYGASLRPDVVSLTMASKIIGVLERQVSDLVEGGTPHPERVHVPRKSWQVFISTASLLEFIGRQLARRPDGTTFLTAQEWWDMRVKYNYEELLTVQKIQRRYRTHERVVKRHIDDGTFPCLYTVGKQARIPLHAATTWAVPRQQISPELVVKTLGVTTAEATLLVSTHRLCIKQHGPRALRDCPTPVCFEQYLAANRTHDGFAVAEWLTWCLQDGMRIRQQGTTTQEVETNEFLIAIEEGRIRGIWMPGRLSVAVLDEDMWALRRYIRSIQNRISPDYHRRLDEV